MRFRKSDWLFRSEVTELNPDVEILGQYVDASTKIKVRCKRCGEEYYDLPANILAGKLHRKTVDGAEGCKWCNTWHHYRNKRLEIANKLKHIYIQHSAKIEFTKPYDPVTSQIQCKCKNCKCVFSENLNTLYNLKYACPNCKPNKEEKKVITPGEVKIKKLFENNMDVRLISKAGSILTCKCNKCEKTFEVKGFMKRRKISCPHCYKEKRNTIKKDRKFENKNPGYTSIKRECEHMSYCISRNDFLCNDCKILSTPYYTKDEFKSIIESTYPHIELLGEYIDSITKIDYKCKKCGNVYSAKPAKIYYGECGCKVCH